MRSKVLFIRIAAIFVLAIAAIGARSTKVTRQVDEGPHFKVLGKAGIPHEINYQGYLTDDAGNAITDALEMVFSIWDTPSSGNQLWSETQPEVAVIDGLFNVLLGSVNPIPPGIFTGAPCWLQTQVGSEILSPRKEIVSVGYAYCAGRADSANVAGYAHDADMVDGQHASDFLSMANDWGRSGVATDLYEGTTKLTDRYVNEGQANSITSGMIVDGTIQQADLAFSPGDGHSLDAADGSPVDALYVDNEGNVGIGTTSPGYPLHVKKAVANIFATSVENESPEGWGLEVRTADTSASRSAFEIYTGDPIFGPKFTVRNNGNVGIGMGLTTPTEKLSVVGTIESTSGGFKFPDGTVQISAATGGVGDGHSLDAVDGDPVDVVYVDSVGNVGIGTTSPGDALHIAPSTYTSKIRIENIAGGEGHVDFWEGTHAKAAIRYMSPTCAWDPNRLQIFTVAGTNASINIAAEGATSSGLTVSNSNNVGIGTTSPAQKLDVAGTVQMTGFKLPTGATGGYVLTSDASGIGTWQAAAGGIGGGGTANYIPKFTAATTVGNSVIYETGGNVGIGTTSPAGKLEIKGNQNHLYLDQLSSPGSITMIYARRNGIDKWKMGLYGSNDNFALYVPSVLAISATSTGNVGIGKVDATEKLDVNGNAKVSGDIYEGTTKLADKYVNEGQSNSITSGMIQDGQVTSADIADNSVGEADLANSFKAKAVDVYTTTSNDYVINVNWIQIYTYGTYGALRIRNAHGSYSLMYWYSVDNGTPTSGVLSPGQTVNVTTPTYSCIEIRASLYSVANYPRFLSFTGLNKATGWIVGIVTYSVGAPGK